MSVFLNGRICCALDLPCCSPPPGVARADAQAEAVCYLLEKAYAIDGSMMTVAHAVLDNFDLVPKGAGSGIAAAYAPFLRKA